MDKKSKTKQNRISSSLLVCTIVTLFLFGCAHKKKKMNSEEWIQDINYFAQHLPQVHANLFFNLSEIEFNNRIDILKSKVDSLSDKEIIFSLMQITASIGDAHSDINYPSYKFNFIPIDTYICNDGVLIVRSTEQYKYLIGKKIVKINDMDIENIQDTLEAFIPHENEFWLKCKIPEYIMNADLLKFSRVIDSPDTIQVSYLDNGKIHDVKIATIQSHYLSTIKMINYFDFLNLEPPLAWRNTNKAYWYYYFDKNKVLYFQYNQCVDLPLESFGYFCEKLYKFISQHPVHAIIIDVRFNTGGNSNLFSDYFSPKLKQFTQQNDIDIYTIIGRRTFSSGLWVAIEMKKDYHSLLIGEPTGSKPNSYGDYRTFMLPNSKLYTGYSIKYWKMLDSEDDALYPDSPIKIESKDILAGKDQFLDRVFELINHSDNETMDR